MVTCFGAVAINDNATLFRVIQAQVQFVIALAVDTFKSFLGDWLKTVGLAARVVVEGLGSLMTLMLFAPIVFLRERFCVLCLQLGPNLLHQSLPMRTFWPIKVFGLSLNELNEIAEVWSLAFLPDSA